MWPSSCKLPHWIKSQVGTHVQEITDLSRQVVFHVNLIQGVGKGSLLLNL